MIIMAKRLICILFCCISSCVLFSQQRMMKGLVKEANTENPIEGAMITIQENNKTIISNKDGFFEISITRGNVLIVSALSYVSKTIIYQGDAFININLDRDSSALSEFIVTGIGKATSTKKASIDVASFSMKASAKSAVANLEQAIQGRLAGLNIQFTSGLPGTSAQIFLRGINDLSGTGPLIMLDGLEIQGGLYGIDPNSIEKVEIVKGAAGGTLYGAQGANGIIQLFSKKGTKGRSPSISFRTQLSLDRIVRGKNIVAKYHSYQTDQYGFIVNAFGNEMSPDQNNAWTDPIFLEGSDVMNNKVYREKTFDHIQQAYRNALTSNINLNISGGGPNSDYVFSLGFLNQQNVLFNGYKRYQLGNNFGVSLTKKCTIRSNTQLILSDEDLLAGGNRFGLTNSWKYIDFTAKDSLGFTTVKPKLNENMLNPLSEREWRTRSSKELRVLQNFDVNFQPTKKIELDYKYGLEYVGDDSKDYYFNQSASAQSNVAYWGTNAKGSISKTFHSKIFQNSLLSAYLKYDFDKDLKINIPIQTNTQISYDWRNLKNTEYIAQGSVLPDFPPYNINTASIKTSGDLDNQFITYGFLVNQNIDYGEWGGLTLGYRSDYSSEFGDAKKPQQFYRAAAYIRPTQLMKCKFLSEWKLRGAFGQAGIQPYSFLPYARQLVYDVATVGTGGIGISSPAQSSNPLLKLSTSNEFEIGTDFSLPVSKKKWFRKCNVSVTYWKRKVLNAYQYGDNSPSTGFTQAVDNLTDLSSHGIDAAIDADMFHRRYFSWLSSIRITQYKVMADRIANGKDVIAGIFALKQGQELGTIVAQTALTQIDQLKPDGTRYIPSVNANNYEIVNGMVVEKSTKKVMLTSIDDRAVIGSVYPKFNASFIQEFNFSKHWTLELQMDWKYGNKIYNLTRQWLYRDRLSADYDNPITIGGQTGAFVNYYNSFYNGVNPVDWFVESGSMLRLRDASVSYRINNSLSHNRIKSIVIAFAARNLLTITRYKGLDPEATSKSDAQGNEINGLGAASSVDYFGVPNLKSFIFSLNIVL